MQLIASYSSFLFMQLFLKTDRSKYKSQVISCIKICFQSFISKGGLFFLDCCRSLKRLPLNNFPNEGWKQQKLFTVNRTSGFFLPWLLCGEFLLPSYLKIFCLFSISANQIVVLWLEVTYVLNIRSFCKFFHLLSRDVLIIVLRIMFPLSAVFYNYSNRTVLFQEHFWLINISI